MHSMDAPPLGWKVGRRPQCDNRLPGDRRTPWADVVGRSGDTSKGMGIASTTRPSIDPGEIHDILRNDRRRRVIKQLQQRLEPVTLRELSERIAEHESGTAPAPRKLRESVYNSLHQTHLPKLDERGIVEYDENRKTVRLCEGARHVDVYMEVITRYGITWAAFYRTLGVLALLAILAAQIEAPVISIVSPLAWATGFLTVFALATSYQLWSRRWFYLRSVLQ
jgi:hypothetical protein